MCVCVICIFAADLFAFERHVHKAVDQLVEIVFGNKPFFNRRDDLRVANAVGGGHFQLLPREKTLHAVVFRAPVGDNNAFKSPFVTKHVGKQPFVFCAVGAVQAVVCRHNRPGLCLFDRVFKRRQVNFAQGAFVHNRVDGHAAGFLVVRGKVLNGSADALALHAVDKRSGHFAGQIRVFREIFKVSAAERRAFDVDARAEQNGNLFFQALFTERFAHLINHVRVPRAGGCRRSGIANRGNAF